MPKSGTRSRRPSGPDGVPFTRIACIRRPGKADMIKEIIMKSRLLWMLASMFMGFAALTGNLATAAETSMSDMTSRACDDWNFNDPNCPSYISPESSASGRAAFGTPSGMPRGDESRACDDWSFNDSKCSAYIDRTAMAGGQAAYGMPSTLPSGDESRACDDWSFNDSRCSAYIR